MNTLVTRHKVAAAEKTKKLISGFVYYALALILLFTGITKIIDPLPLINTLKLLPIINEQLVVLTATILPMLEIVLGLLMLLKIETKITLTAVAILFFAFFGFSIYGAIAGFEGDCGCLSANTFGAGFGNAIKSDFGWEKILRKSTLLVGSEFINFNRNVLQDK